jgi:protoporphyrinogen oxidase
MSTKPKKPPGHTWEVFFVYFDGEDDSMQVTGCWTPEEAIAQARDALDAYAKSDDEKDQFEIVAVVRSDAAI